jgi:hypothetical protein
MRAFSPTGVPIVSTLESLIGTCGVEQDSFIVDEDGELTYLHDDNGTDICWDACESVVRDGQQVFCDANGDEWLESELVLK